MKRCDGERLPKSSAAPVHVSIYVPARGSSGSSFNLAALVAVELIGSMQIVVLPAVVTVGITHVTVFPSALTVAGAKACTPPL